MGNLIVILFVIGFTFFTIGAGLVLWGMIQ